MLQHAQFVAAGDAQVLGEVAAGDLFHCHHGVAQRAGDLPGDQHCRQYADQQRQQRGNGLQAASLGAFDVAALQLDLVQRVAALDDVGTLHGHFGARSGDVGDRIAELAHGVTVGQHRAFELLQARVFGRQLALEIVDFGQGGVQLAQGGLLVGSAVFGNVAAYVDAHLQQLLAGLADQLVLGQAHAVGFGARHDFGEQHLNIFLFAQNPADRRRDVAGRQGRGRDLIEKRLEQVVVVTVEQRDAHVSASEPARGVEAGKAAADDDNMRFVHATTPFSVAPRVCYRTAYAFETRTDSRRPCQCC